MKKTIKLIIASFFVVIFLSGCQKSPDPKVAVETFVDSYIYGEDSKKLTEYFELDSGDFQKELQTDFVSNLKVKFGLDDTYEERLNKLYQEVESKIKQNSSYKTKMITNKKGKAEVRLTIMGMNDWEDAQLDAEIERIIKENETQITAETTPEQLAKLAKDVSMTVLENNLAGIQKSPESVTLKVNLIVDPENKSKWLIQNEDTFLTELGDAFGL